MQRRRFIRDLLGGATAIALTPALLGRQAWSGESAQFAAGLQRHGWLAGWQNAAAETMAATRLTIQGRLPRELTGTLYRNGPALFERNGFRYGHWFDGDGMVHRWHLGARSITHSARMVATPKYVDERRAGRFLHMGAGTSIPDPQPARNNDDGNTANTSVMVLNGRLFALWEGGSAFELDPETLHTLGPIQWRQDLTSLPFSAHPLRDRDGSVWNFGSIAVTGGSGVVLYHIDRLGHLIEARMLDVPGKAYLHSFAMTDEHLVLVLAPFRLKEAGAFFERLEFTPSEGSLIAVVDKRSTDRVRWFEADFAMAYHFGDAFEKDGHIVVRTVQHPDLQEARAPMAKAMSGGVDPGASHTKLIELHIDIAGDKAHWQDTGMISLEFPQFDPRSASDRGARIYAPTTDGVHVAPYFNAIAAFDGERNIRDVHRYGESILAEEHVFVPRPGSSRANEGWLIGTLLDSARGRSGIAVLDALRIGDGPLAQAWLPGTIPLGFHGCFTSA